MDVALRAGMAVFNDGRHHAAHDAWEPTWLAVEGDDARLLQGLIQFAAALHHARTANWSGLRGLARGAADYLGPLPADYRGVNVGAVRAYAAATAADPERVERRAPPALTHRGRRVTYADVDAPATFVAASALAEGTDHEAVVEDAVRYARAALDEGRPTSPFVTLVVDYVREGQAAVVVQRLGEHVERRRSRERDVEGLFEAGDGDE